MQRLARGSSSISRQFRLGLTTPFLSRTPRAHQVRLAHTTTNKPPRDGFPVLAIFSVLAAFGVAATGYGLYEFYTSFTLWPKALRDDLRAGIKAQHRENLVLGEKYLTRAWETCRAMPREELGADPWLKISGVACKLGEVLEAAKKPEQAYQVYAQCCSLMQATPGLSMIERHRAIAMAVHLGHLARELGKPPAEEEEWLLWSVEEFINIYKSNSGDEGLRHLSDPEATALGLPKWTSKDEFESALEALGSCYARQGNAEYAVGLYLRAISHLLRPEAPLDVREAVSPQDRCKAAQLMNNISSLLIQANPSPERLAQAKSWADKGLQLAERGRDVLTHSSRPAEPECERVLAVIMYNLGAILEMQNDPAAAKEQFKRALEQSRQIGLHEGVLEADDALARLSIKKTP
ncbi:hypothetical protein BU17DRAFT_84935 [Hysterangium stoloniferum]|nr:hypothetical protein BU17DRAFT_84935 [Hysterangium stoloniferum]